MIGVMPREFYFMPARDIDLWMPTGWSPEMLRRWYWHDVHCVARLKPGVTLSQAKEAMAALNLRISAEHVKPPRSAVVSSLRDDLTGKTYSSLIVLQCASAAVLLGLWITERQSLGLGSREQLGPMLRFGLPTVSTRETGLAASAKCAAYRLFPRARWLPKGKGAARNYPKDLRVAPVAPLGFSPDDPLSATRLFQQPGRGVSEQGVVACPVGREAGEAETQIHSRGLR